MGMKQSVGVWLVAMGTAACGGSTPGLDAGRDDGGAPVDAPMALLDTGVDPVDVGAPDAPTIDAPAALGSIRCADLPGIVQGAATDRIGYVATLVCGTPDGGSCTLTDDTRTTGPGVCPADMQVMLVGWNGSAGELELRAAGWSIVSSSVGVVIPSMGVLDIPADTDATVVLRSPSSATYTFTARISAAATISVTSFVAG